MNQFPLTALFSTSLYRLTGFGRPNKPSTDAFKSHAKAALNWIERAIQNTDDGGVSKGFDLLRGRWAPSYPETTGYTIPTLINASKAFDVPDWEETAISLANYELINTTPEGGVVHWKDNEMTTPIVFDTGQVIFGWLAAYRITLDSRYIEAAKNAGNWLVSIQDPTGMWKRNQYLDVPKVIDTRVAWALLELSDIVEDRLISQVAEKNLKWAIKQQDDSGWFHHCAFRTKNDPYTHTLAYTTEGLLECSTLLDMPDLFAAARKTADALMELQRPDGSLAGTYGPKWSRPSHWSCLTGNCQIARLWFRIYQITDEPAYYDAGQKAIQYVAATQNISTPNQNINGAISGSQPLWGKYEFFKTPNWAAKFFIDAILQYLEIKQKKKLVIYSG